MRGKNRVVNLFKKMTRAMSPFTQGLVVGAFGFGVLALILGQLGLVFLLKSDDEKAFYTLGQVYAQQVETLQLNPSEVRSIVLGFQEGVERKAARIDTDSYRVKLDTLMDARQSHRLEKVKKEGQEYLSHFVRSGGIVSLSGLAYKVVTPGSAKKPTLRNWVEVSYRGTGTDGKVFDGTRGDEKAKFPMNAVIPGWSEGLQQIGEGGEIELVIPSSLAYGDVRTASGIPAGSTLYFRIRLYRVLESGS